jgi:hypothetical protein
MPVLSETHSRRHLIVVQHPQNSEIIPLRVTIIGKTEGVVLSQPWLAWPLVSALCKVVFMIFDFRELKMV